MSIPVAAAGQSAAPDLAVAYDMQQRRLLVFDGCGRRLVEPLPIDHPFAAMPAMPWLGQSFPIEPSLVGRVLFVRTTSGVTAFDLAAAPGESRTLWRHGGRPERCGTRRWSESSPAPAVGSTQRRRAAGPEHRRTRRPRGAGGRAGSSGPRRGVIAAGGRSVTLLDPVSGHVLWERHGLPAVSEWIGDDDVLCGCTVDGRNSPVLSMRDGRLLHAVDVPGRRQRFATYGRRLLAIAPLDDGPIAARVRIDVVDPVDRESRPLGEFSGNARAAPVGGDHLAVVEPNGGLTLIDLRAGGVSFRTHLPGMTGRPGYLHASAWQDRYLVFVGGDDEPAFGTPDDGGMALAHQRDDGQRIDAAPVGGRVGRRPRRRRHALAGAGDRQSALPPSRAAGGDLPVLLFCRQTRAGRRRRAGRS